MKINNKKYGDLGEQKACEYLKNKEYKIIEKNLSYKFGEVDIVAIKEGVLTFFEVKARNNLNFGLPSEAVDSKKIEKIRKVASYYISKTHLDYSEVSFDILEVYLKENRINHIEGAF